MALAFAAAESRPTAVLTGPCVVVEGAGPSIGQAGAYDMAEVPLEGRPLTATAGLVWTTDLPRQLQQILFDSADGVGCVPLAQAS